MFRLRLQKLYRSGPRTSDRTRCLKMMCAACPRAIVIDLNRVGGQPDMPASHAKPTDRLKHCAAQVMFLHEQERYQVQAGEHSSWLPLLL